MLQPGTLFSWRLWRHQNRLTLMISVFPNHLDRSEMLFWRIGLRKSWMTFAIIIPIGSHKMHHWSRRLLVWGENCRVWSQYWSFGSYVGQIARLGLYATEKNCSYAHDVKTKNNTFIWSPEIHFGNTVLTSWWVFSSTFTMCPSKMQYVPKVSYNTRRNGS